MDSVKRIKSTLIGKAIDCGSIIHGWTNKGSIKFEEYGFIRAVLCLGYFFQKIDVTETFWFKGLNMRRLRMGIVESNSWVFNGDWIWYVMIIQRNL